ncbi:hypothetical protein [Paracoccus saliphilus]|uniref:Uncharacterized protein n=1 Tax=Paracoccus saliphilus TaxID=405559 RepID=A0AA46A4C1_9RHOB|nr:hypothetical protein [Paracoccus saliphilus]SIS58919.1 hypothetical protein SAMN05421772_101670 [Paracoccus saliphilus]
MRPALTVDLLAGLLAQPKEAVSLSRWAPKNRPSTLEIKSSVTTNDVTIAGLELYMRCVISQPDEQVTIGLNVETLIGPKCFARVDWRHSSTHINTKVICGEQLRHTDAGRTHFHDPRLYESIEEPMDFIKANLPIAVALVPVPDSYRDLLENCATLLNVRNLPEAPIPPWQPNTSFL